MAFFGALLGIVMVTRAISSSSIKSFHFDFNNMHLRKTRDFIYILINKSYHLMTNKSEKLHIS